jgi:CheY-like chemotaxis protein
VERMDDKILVVEDEIITAEHIKLALKNQGYQVVSLLISGEEAINKVEDTEVDLVLMDINLKGEMDGVEAAEEIWNSHSIPVIFLTAYSDEKTLQRAKITETSVKKSFGVLNKPFKEEDLHSLIEKTLHGK